MEVAFKAATLVGIYLLLIGGMISCQDTRFAQDRVDDRLKEVQSDLGRLERTVHEVRIDAAVVRARQP